MKKALHNKTFEEIFNLHYEGLIAFVYGYVRDEDTAKDIVHDVFLNYLEHENRLDLTYSVKSYLYTLAKHSALNYLRHLQVVELNEHEVSELMEQSGEMDEYDERCEMLERRLALLPDRQREIFMKCVVDEKKYKEVADELGISINTVKKQMVRAMKFMREELCSEWMWITSFLIPAFM